MLNTLVTLSKANPSITLIIFIAVVGLVIAIIKISFSSGDKAGRDIFKKNTQKGNNNRIGGNE